MKTSIDMTGQTKRLEAALRDLAKSGGNVAGIAKKHRVEKSDIWNWLGQFNHSRPSLSEHVIDGVLGGQARAMPKLRSDLNKPRGERIRKAAILGAKPPVLVPVIAGPLGKAGVLDTWLHGQGLESEPELSFVVNVTPAIAARWLTLNTGNRKPSAAKVKRFAAVIQSGKWILNGETVKFSESGRLLDGQSRLRAIVEANTPADLEVRGGLPDAVQETMDCGESRKGTHTLEMMGEENPKVLSPALRLVFKWEQGQLGSGGSGRGKMSVLENLAIKPMLERHPGLRLSVAWAVGLGIRLQKYLPHSEAAFFHYVFGLANRLKRDAFFDGLRSANGMTQPVALLRSRILEAQTGRMSAGVRLRLLVKAWNAHYAGRNIPALTLAPRESVAAIAGAMKEAA